MEEVLFENQNEMKVCCNKDTIGIKETELYIVPLKNYPQKSVGRLLGKQPEQPSSLAHIPDFCSPKKCALMKIFSLDFQGEKMPH